MIDSTWIHGKEVQLFSIGHLAAKLGRSVGSVRRLESNNVVPEPYTRSKKNYRLYTKHEINIIVAVFRDANLRQGKKIDEDTVKRIHTLWNALRDHYNNPDNSLPKEATNAEAPNQFSSLI